MILAIGGASKTAMTKYPAIPSRDIDDMDSLKLRKSTLAIGTLSVLLILAIYIWAATNPLHRKETTLSDEIMIWTIIFSLVSAMTVSWEAGDYIWFALFGLGYLNLFSGSLTLSAFIDITVFPLYVIVKRRSWRSFYRKIKSREPDGRY